MLKKNKNPTLRMWGINITKNIRKKLFSGTWTRPKKTLVFVMGAPGGGKNGQTRPIPAPKGKRKN